MTHLRRMCSLTPYTYTVVIRGSEADMLTTDPRDALALAHHRTRSLRDEAVAEHLRQRPWTRRTVAASLRHLAERIDPMPLAHRPA